MALTRGESLSMIGKLLGHNKCKRPRNTSASLGPDTAPTTTKAEKSTITTASEEASGPCAPASSSAYTAWPEPKAASSRPVIARCRTRLSRQLHTDGLGKLPSTPRTDPFHGSPLILCYAERFRGFDVIIKCAARMSIRAIDYLPSRRHPVSIGNRASNNARRPTNIGVSRMPVTI